LSQLPCVPVIQNSYYQAKGRA